MRTDLTSDELDALAERAQRDRLLVSLFPRNRDTDVRAHYGFWTGGEPGTTTIAVIDPATGAAADPARSFEGGGDLIDADAVALGLIDEIRDCMIRLSGVADQVRAALLTYDPHQCPVQIFALVLDKDTSLPVGPGRCVFDGWLDDIEFPIPAEGGRGDVVLTCSPRARELTRTNPDTCSHASQVRRTAAGCPEGDHFLLYAGQTWEIVWGEDRSKATKG